MSKLLLISNLLLGGKLVRASAPKILNSFGKFGGNPWDALRASRILASKKPMSSLLVSPFSYPSRGTLWVSTFLISRPVSCRLNIFLNEFSRNCRNVNILPVFSMFGLDLSNTLDQLLHVLSRLPHPN